MCLPTGQDGVENRDKVYSTELKNVRLLAHVFHVIRFPESGKFLLVESRILGFKVCNPESKFHCKESGIHAWNPESKTDQDCPLEFASTERTVEPFNFS